MEISKRSEDRFGDVKQVSAASPAASPREMRRVAFASFMGTLIEFYDFFIYGTAAALVFPKVFFPELGPAAGIVASFATLGVAFVARPLGSIIFGHFGDRLGRKKTLVATLLLMGIATVLIGLMPTTDQIGILAPILIVFLRFLQGLAAGGEWAGGVLFTVENAPLAQRGFWSAFATIGGGLGLVLGNATFMLAGISMSDEAFLNYGWRIPFIASILLVGVGLYIRLSTNETAVFRSEASRGTSKMPFIEVLKHQPRQVLLGAGVPLIGLSLYYVAASYLVNYGTAVLGHGRTEVLTISMLAGVAFPVGILLGASLSDRIGRRAVIGTMAPIAAVWVLAVFPILDTGGIWAFAVVLFVTMLISGIAQGPVGVLMSELFHTRYRYSGAGLTYSIAGVLGGAVTPLVAAWMAGGFALGIYLSALGMISLICVLVIGETRNYALDREESIPSSGAPSAGKA